MDAAERPKLNLSSFRLWWFEPNAGVVAEWEHTRRRAVPFCSPIAVPGHLGTKLAVVGYYNLLVAVRGFRDFDYRAFTTNAIFTMIMRTKL